MRVAHPDGPSVFKTRRRRRGARRPLRRLPRLPGPRRLSGQQGLVDVRDDAAPGDRRLDQGVKLLVSADGQREVPRGDALGLVVFGHVACELEDLCSQVLHRRCQVHPGGRSAARALRDVGLQQSVNPPYREMHSRPVGAGKRMVTAHLQRLLPALGVLLELLVLGPLAGKGLVLLLPLLEHFLLVLLLLLVLVLVGLALHCIPPNRGLLAQG
mmetsp:Transcript_33200/g.95297  ORF Transcript_33200/g.95297 Transcript_33200/m.95297 type:complete len:213 (-) Transcript_33200:289-927(-)